jgi:hypothetical protein
MPFAPDRFQPQRIGTFSPRLRSVVFLIYVTPGGFLCSRLFFDAGMRRIIHLRYGNPGL